MDILPNLEGFTPEIEHQIQTYEHTLRESGEFPTREWSEEDKKNFKTQLIQLEAELRVLIGNKTFEQLNEFIVKRIDQEVEEVINQIHLGKFDALDDSEKYIGSLIVLLYGLISAFQRTGIPYMYYEHDSKERDSLNKGHFYVNSILNRERAHKISNLVWGLIESKHNKERESKAKSPEVIKLVEEIDLLRRECEECPTRAWNKKKIQKMRNTLVDKRQELYKNIGIEQLQIILNEGMEVIDEEVVAQLSARKGFLWEITYHLQYILRELSSSSRQLHWRIEDNFNLEEMKLEIWRELRIYVSKERANKIFMYFYNLVKDDIKIEKEP